MLVNVERVCAEGERENERERERERERRVALCVPSITRTFSPSGYRAWPFLRAVHPARLQSWRIIESAAYLVRPD